MQPQRSSIHLIVSIICIVVVAICGTAGYIYVRYSDTVKPDRAHKTTSKVQAPPPSATAPEASSSANHGYTQSHPQNQQPEQQQPPINQNPQPQTGSKNQTPPSLSPEPSPRPHVPMEGHVHIGDAHYENRLCGWRGLQRTVEYGPLPPDTHLTQDYYVPLLNAGELRRVRNKGWLNHARRRTWNMRIWVGLRLSNRPHGHRAARFS